MPTITIKLSDSQADALMELTQRCGRGDATTHGPLDVPALLTMLAEDAAMVIDRPGSWEGAKMADLLESHGYEI